MNDSLSIDEIIKQAEEIREKTVKKAQSALEDVNNSAKEITEREIEVPKPEPENIKIASKSDKSSKFKQNEVADKTKVSPAIKADDKTKHIEFKPKSNQIDRDFEEQKTVQKSFFSNKNLKEPIYSKKPPEIIERPATIKSKSKFDKTEDLEQIPTIVAVEELEKPRFCLRGKKLSSAKKKRRSKRKKNKVFKLCLTGLTMKQSR